MLKYDQVTSITSIFARYAQILVSGIKANTVQMYSYHNNSGRSSILKSVFVNVLMFWDNSITA